MISGVASVPRRLDLVILGCALSLALLGILFVASTTGAGRLQGLATRQALWVAVGLAGLIVAVLFDYRTLLKISFPLYCATLVPLVYLLFFGVRIQNVKSWIRFGSFQFQPAELAKISTALLVAYLFENEDDGRLRLSAFVKLGAIVGIPFLLVFLQPDLGLALTILPLLAVGLFFGGLPLRGWIAIFLVVAVCAGGAWFFLKDYQKQRISPFFNPDQDVLKS
ncbi:MAG: FtsW/RodA/SpoVE family cell cycle protein, partial [Acidobacteriota bacterium]|nr:FtsW/RodA/SpoVE family cell cycle protein [Acidobacteriota bacterium]